VSDVIDFDLDINDDELLVEMPALMTVVNVKCTS